MVIVLCALYQGVRGKVAEEEAEEEGKGMKKKDRERIY